MSTFAQVRERIEDDTQSGSGIQSQIDQQIKLAIKHYRTLPFWFNEAQTTLSASLAYVALPSDYVSEVALYLTESGTDRLLTRWTQGEIFTDRPSTGGRPTAYTIFGDRIEFNRSCDQTYTLPFKYIKELTELSADADTNEWLVSGEDLIVYRAEKMLYDRVLKNKDEAARCASLEREAYNALNRFSQSRVGTGYTVGHYL
jgi:hypothetical protein